MAICESNKNLMKFLNISHKKLLININSLWEKAIIGQNLNYYENDGEIFT